MAFTKENARTPTGIGLIEVRLTDQDPADPAQSIAYRIEINFSDGRKEIRAGDLRQHLTAAQITQLTNFLTTIRTKATNEFIG